MKETTSKVKRQPSEWEKIIENKATDKELISKIYKQLVQLMEQEMATHSSVLAWRIPGTGRLVGCCLWGRTELDTTEAI